MILHYAHLCDAAGGVDAFLIGSEMRGITQVRSGAAAYPAVQAFVDLAADCRAILGSGTKISYAADWSEYFGHHPQDGSGDVFFHLDPLWADANVDFVGIDNYMPLSDWRDGGEHLDALGGLAAVHDLAYLQSNIEGGEGFDWFYASAADRDGAGSHADHRRRRRQALGVPLQGSEELVVEPAFRPAGRGRERQPDGMGAREQADPLHRGRRARRSTAAPTSRTSSSTRSRRSPSCPTSRAASATTSSSAATSRRSAATGTTRANNPASGVYAGRMIETDEIAFWSWDARPFPAFPARGDVWTDGGNWRLGHWLTGRLGGTGLAELVRELCRRGGLPEGLADTSRLSRRASRAISSAALESARGSIEPLMRAFAFDGVETDGSLRFVHRGGRAGRRHRPGIARRGRASARTRTCSCTRGQETELPLALKWRVVKADEEFGGLTVEARRITVDAARVRSESFEIAMPQSAADRAARRALFEEWIGREEAAFALPPSMLALDPTDVVRIEHDGRTPEYQLARITDGDARRIEARRTDRRDLRPAAGPGPRALGPASDRARAAAGTPDEPAAALGGCARLATLRRRLRAAVVRAGGDLAQRRRGRVRAARPRHPPGADRHPRLRSLRRPDRAVRSRQRGLDRSRLRRARQRLRSGALRRRERPGRRVRARALGGAAVRHRRADRARPLSAHAACCAASSAPRTRSATRHPPAPGW